MRRTIVVFGLISGAISSLLMIITVPFGDRIGIDHSYVIGYTAIVLSFLMVFFGIKSYRDNVGGGEITFSKAFVIGISITVISCLLYVITWEIVYYNFMPDFMDKWSAHVLDKLRAAGASAAAIDAKMQQMQKYKELYANPLTNGAMTFMEPFPVGLLITLISSAVLRKKPQQDAAQAPLPVA